LKHGPLQQFRSLDPEAFASLTRHLGYSAAACYRWSDDALVQMLGTEAVPAWPAAVSFVSDYTASGSTVPPLGWARPAALGISAKGWPKGVVLYVPGGVASGEPVVLAVVLAPGKRVRDGELSGPLEAAASRIRGWLRDQTERLRLSEEGLSEHLRRLGVDLRMLLDHELRTPLSSVAGYAALLAETDPASSDGAEAWREYVQVLGREVGNALDVIDKISIALHTEPTLAQTASLEPFDAEAEVRSLCVQLEERGAELLGAEASQRLSVRLQRATDQSCRLQADRHLFSWALWEVLKNAATHARSGQVDVRLYTSDRMLVIDVQDDGSGVSPGMEELIFLRFYQDPGTQHLRRGKRGLGLGLFLARHIVERHLGRLTFIRQRGASLFRFVWPLPEESDLSFKKGA